MGEEQQSTPFNNRNDFYSSSSASQLDDDRDDVNFDDRMHQIEEELNKISGGGGGFNKQMSVWEEFRKREENAQQVLARGEKMASMKTLLKKAMLKEGDEV